MTDSFGSDGGGVAVVGWWVRVVSSVLLVSCGVVRAELGVEDSVSVPEAVARGVALIVDRQESLDEAGSPDALDEWPYEGVYRVRGKIPIGYRVGGSGIAILALVDAPGWDDDAPRRAAVERATEFIVRSIEDPLMAHRVQARYDVRGWGFTYGLASLLRLQALDRVPAQQRDGVDRAVRFFIAGINATAIPERGGWNYSRRAGFDKPGRPSPFMTGPTLQALFAAREAGYEVDDAIVVAGLEALEKARTSSGAYVYAGDNGASSRTAVPGSVGRMLVGEVTLALAGRSTDDRIRGAVDAFIVHWEWLEKRRAKTGTHVKPYGIAPYYFFYAHYYAAQAVHMLPEQERAEYQRRLRDLLFSVREGDGGWNDRVFARSAAYGTSMAVLVLTMPDMPRPSAWTTERALDPSGLDEDIDSE